jgi:hypothetical protein
MSAEKSSEQVDAGIFGNLPTSRPGSRSPRRTGGDGDAGTREESRAEAKARPEPEPPPPPPPRPASEAPEPEPPPEDAEQGQRGLEDLAWAGVTAAAEAATIGVRLATRALEAARKAAER